MTISESNQYYQNPEPCQMELVFSETGEDDITLTNTDICSEEMSLEESLCSEENLMFGACESSCFKVRVVNYNSFKGKTLIVTQKIKSSIGRLADSSGNEVVDDSGNYIAVSNFSGDYTEVPFGTYKVYSDKPSNDRMWRDLVCYDAMYEILNADVSSWYSGLTFPMTIKALRDSFFTYLGITQKTQTLINDNYVTQGGFTAEGTLAGKVIIESICELNACFGHIDRDGKFEYICLPTSDSVTLGWYHDGTGKFEDYTTDVITGVTARSEADDVGTSVGTDTNQVIIEGNPLIYGDEGNQTLIDALDNILDVVETVTYRPFSIDTYGNPCLPIGTNITYTTRVYDPENGYQDLTVNSIIVSRVLKGIQGLVDSLSATGNQQRPNEANSLKSELLRTAGKTHKLKIVLDTFESEVSDAFEQTDSLIRQTADNIMLEVNKVEQELAYPCVASAQVNNTYFDATGFLTEEEYDNLLTFVTETQTGMAPADFIPPELADDKYLFSHFVIARMFSLGEVYESGGNYSWTNAKPIETSAGVSTKSAKGITVDLSNEKPFQDDWIPEFNVNTTLEVTLNYIWATSSDNEYFVKLVLKKLSTSSYTRDLYYPIYDHGEVLNPSNYSVGDKICIKFVPWSEISDEMNPYGFKYAFKIIDKNYKSTSRIDMLGNQIVLSVNSAGRIVTTELGVDPSSSTSYFQVNADNINLSANDVFNIMSGGTMNIEAKNIAITTTSGKFSVTSAGALTCTSGKIADWTIDSSSLYKLTGTEGHSTSYSKTLLKPSEIRFYENNPNTTGEMSIQLNSQGFFHYSYFNNTWVKDFAIDFHQVGLQTYDVNRLNPSTGSSTSWAHTNEISLNDAIESIEPYYRAGTYTFQMVCYGFLTSGGTTLQIIVPIRILNGLKISGLGSLKIRLRKPSGGYIMSDGEDVTLLVTSKTISYSQGFLSFLVTRSGGWNEPNNIPFTGVVDLTNILFEYA